MRATRRSAARSRADTTTIATHRGARTLALGPMSHHDVRAEQPEQVLPPTPPVLDDDPPARRLLAHDLEHMVWDHDAETAAPPPD